jgi:hypothetical protein
VNGLVNQSGGGRENVLAGARRGKDAATARALVSFLRSAAAQDMLKRKGMDLP